MSGFSSAQHFAPDLATTASKSGQAMYGVGGRGPHSDMNYMMPFAGTAAATDRQQQMNQLNHDMGMSDLTYGSRGGIRELEGLMNNRQMEGVPVVVRRMIIDTAVSPDDPHFQIMPPKKMPLSHIAGRTVKTIEVARYMPQETPEFVPPSFQGYKVSEFTQRPKRYATGYRMSGDMIESPQGQELEMMWLQAITYRLRELGAMIVTSTLLSVPDRYRTKRSQTLIGQYTSEELRERAQSQSTPMNGGEILTDPGMFGVFNRKNGFEYVMSWARRMFSTHGLRVTHIVKSPGILMNEAYRTYRTQYANRGEEAMANLTQGEDAMNGKMMQAFPGVTVVDEPIYESENTPSETRSLLETSAQVGRYYLLDNKPHEDMLSMTDATEYAKHCSGGNHRANDLYYFDLTGDGEIAKKTYDELVRACVCFDEGGRLNQQVYNALIEGEWKKYANEMLGMNVSNEKRFKLDPWVVHEKNRNRLVRVVGNQDISHTNVDTTRSILQAACRSIYHNTLGESGFRKIDNLIKWMRRNHKVSADREGNVEGFFAALAWENVNDADVSADTGVSIIRELQNTRGSTRPPRVAPIMTTNDTYSIKYVGFVLSHGGVDYTLVKVNTLNFATDGALTFDYVAAQYPDLMNPQLRTLSRAFPQYAFLPATFLEDGRFDENRRTFTLLEDEEGNEEEIGNVLGIYGGVFENATFDDVRPVLWPRQQINGAVMPGFYTFSNVRALIDLMDTTVDMNGWISVLGEGQIQMLRDGYEMMMTYANMVQRVFSPSGGANSSLAPNLFFRDSVLPAYQRAEGDRRANEIAAFLQLAICGIAPELGAVAPFAKLQNDNSNSKPILFSPRYAMPTQSDDNAENIVSVGLFPVLGNAVSSVASGFYNLGDVGGDLRNVAAVGPYGGMRFLAPFDTFEGTYQPSFSEEQLLAATQILGFNVPDRDVYNQWKTNQIEGFTRDNYKSMKPILITGSILHNLQANSDYSYLRDYLLLTEEQARGANNLEEINTEAWRSFRQKWYSRYQEDTFVPSLRRIMEKVEGKISVEQMQNLGMGRNTSTTRDLKITLNAALVFLDTFFKSVNAFQPIDGDNGQENIPSPWAPLKDRGNSGRAQNEINRFIDQMYDASYRAAQERIVQNETSAPAESSAGGDNAIRRQAANRFAGIYDYLASTSRIKNIVGLRISVDKSYFESVERVARDIMGRDMPFGYGAGLSIVRPASVTEPGEFAGAPAINSSVNSQSAIDNQSKIDNFAGAYRENYEDILKSGGACHRGDETHAERTFSALPAYVGVRARGGSHYGKRRRGYAGRYHSGGSHYKRADQSGTSATDLPADMEAASAVIGAKRGRFFADEEDDDVVDAILTGLIPGVHADELPNSHFKHRLRELGAEVEDKWEVRSMLYAILGAVPSAQLMCNLHRAGIPAPMTLLVLEPFINLRMQGIIMVDGGLELGHLGHNLTIERKGMDTDRTIIDTHVTTVIGGFIDDASRVMTLPHAVHERLEKGGQLSIVKNYASLSYGENEEDIDWDVSNPLDRKDGFVTHCGGSITRQDLPATLPLTGAVDGQQYSVFGDRVISVDNLPSVKDNMQAYPSAIMLNYIAKFPMLNQRVPHAGLMPDSINTMRDYEVGSPGIGRWNMWVSLARQWQPNPNNIGTLQLRFKGCGPIGRLDGDDGAVLNGKPSVFSMGIGDHGLAVETSM